MKYALTHAPFLQLPNFKRPFFFVTNDASGGDIGAVPMQDNHPIAYASRKLKSNELNYSTYDKELVAIVHDLKL